TAMTSGGPQSENHRRPWCQRGCSPNAIPSMSTCGSDNAAPRPEAIRVAATLARPSDPGQEETRKQTGNVPELTILAGPFISATTGSCRPDPGPASNPRSTAFMNTLDNRPRGAFAGILPVNCLAFLLAWPSGWCQICSSLLAW